MIMSGELSLRECRENAGIIKSQSKRMTEIIQQLLDFARRRRPAKTSTDVSMLVKQTVDLLSPLSEKSNVTTNVVTPANPIVTELDPGQIQQVLTNLILNAVQSMPHGGPVTVRCGWSLANPPDDPRTQQIIDAIPVGRLGEPEDVANGVAFFFDERSGFVTGQVLYVCGGVTLARGGS